MHTYIKSEPGLWTVGYYTTGSYNDGGTRQVWHSLKDFDKEREAAALVHYLNGGSSHDTPQAFWGK